jgi:hypothetical protein
MSENNGKSARADRAPDELSRQEASSPCGSGSLSQAEFDAAEQEYTLSGYDLMFERLIEMGRSPAGANAYVVTRATHNHAQRIFVLEKLCKLCHERFKAVDAYMSRAPYYPSNDDIIEELEKTLLSERDRSPKGGNPDLGGSVHDGPVLEEHSPNSDGRGK